MKNLLFFIIHNTSTLEHCQLSLQSLCRQSETTFKFDHMYIYNTQADEITYDDILDICWKENILKFVVVEEICIFDYDKNSPKSLEQDLKNIMTYVTKRYSPDDRVLFMKSDCLLSKYYLKDIEELPDNCPIHFTAPFVFAKKRVPNDEILDYVKRDSFVESEAITFFTEDGYSSHNSDLEHRKDVKITDESVKFFACYGIRCWSCHLITVSLFPLMGIVNQTGIDLRHLEPYFNKTSRSFVVYKYHGIVSENRLTGRWTQIYEWILS